METLSKAVATFNMQDANDQVEQYRLDAFQRAVSGMGIHALIALDDSRQLLGKPASRVLKGEIFDRWVQTAENGGTTLGLKDWKRVFRPDAPQNAPSPRLRASTP